MSHLTTEWASFLDPPAGYDPHSPLVRTCSTDLAYSDTWVSTLLSEAPPRSQAPSFPGELEDRRVEISNFSPEAPTAETVLSVAAEYGDIDSIDTSEKESGKITIKFYDLRAAHRLRASTVRVGGLTWQLQFAHPEKIADLRRPPNSGTLVLFHVPPALTDERIRSEMERFGEIRELRAHSDQRFVEFWDTRHCEDALRATRRGKTFGSRVAVEFSRPGGHRKNPDAFLCHRKPVVARVSKTKAQALNEQIAMHQQSENVSSGIRIEKDGRKKQPEFRCAGNEVAA
jgi:hypothetical protein